MIKLLIFFVLCFVFLFPINAQEDEEIDISDFKGGDKQEAKPTPPSRKMEPSGNQNKNKEQQPEKQPEGKVPSPEVKKNGTEEIKKSSEVQPEVKKSVQPEVKKSPEESQKKDTKTSAEPEKPAAKPQKSFSKEADEEEKEDKFAAPVRIQEERTTRYITLSGFLGFSFNFREDMFADAVLGDKSTNLDEEFFDPRVGIQMEIQMANNIKGIIEVRNEARDEKLHRSSFGTLYVTSRAAENEFRFEFEKAYIQADNFLTRGLKFQGGIIPYKYALRADGQSFFLNMGEAESPFGTRPDTHALGGVLSYQPIQAVELYFDGFYFVTSESGFNRRDENVAGINVDLYLPKTVKRDDESTLTLSRFFNLTFANIQGDNKSEIWTVGFGFDYFFTGDPNIYTVETYGEILFQFGKYNRQGKEPVFSNRDQHQLALGTYIGTRFRYEKSDLKPFADVSFWYLSGDDDDPNRKENHDLVTYEDIDSTMIIEDNDYGLDIDSNYWAIKFKTGMKLNPIINEEMRLEALYAHFEAIDVPKGRSRRMGEEIDVKLIWEYTPDLVFSLSAGFLFRSPYLKDVFDEVGAKGKNHAFMLRFETMLRF